MMNTSKSPSITLRVMRQYWLSLAAGGVSIVRMAVPKIPPPNRYFPPSLFANHPTEPRQNCLDTAETCFVNFCYPLIKVFDYKWPKVLAGI